MERERTYTLTTYTVSATEGREELMKRLGKLSDRHKVFETFEALPIQVSGIASSVARVEGR
jgi:hypothetical protein